MAAISTSAAARDPGPAGGAGAFEHRSVLRDEVVAALASAPAGWVVDCTLGAGGHSEALLQARADLRVLGLDRDPAALAAAGARLRPFGARFQARHARFSTLGAACAEAGIASLSAVVADLGVSSPQVDEAVRGFSFGLDGPLDMRMDPTEGEPALARLRRVGEVELTGVLANFGDVERPRRVARAILAARDAGVTTTAALASAIARAAPSRGRIHPATRAFQALRIWVNGELEELSALLEQAPALLAPGGVLAVISFHSGEDRLVKHALRALAPRGGPFALLERKGRPPSEAELALNPRARSARLRVLQRVPAEEAP